MDPIPLGALGERGARRDVVPWAWRIVNRDGDRGGTEGGGAGGEEEEGDGETPVRWGAESHVLGGRVAREAERVPDHRAPRQGATAQPCSARAWRGSHRARQRGLPRRGKVGREEPGVLRWREWHPKCLHLSLSCWALPSCGQPTAMRRRAGLSRLGGRLPGGRSQVAPADAVLLGGGPSPGPHSVGRVGFWPHSKAECPRGGWHWLFPGF